MSVRKFVVVVIIVVVAAVVSDAKVGGFRRA